MTDTPAPPGDQKQDAAQAAPSPWVRRRRWLSLGARWTLGALAVAFAVVLVATFTIDLGPSVRARAESEAANYLEREVTIGRIGAFIVPGRFLVEDLTIGGLNPGDRPFLTAERVTLSADWTALFHGEVLVDSVLMDNWRMLTESFEDGRHSFPAFVPQSDAPEEEKQTPAPPPSEDEDAGRRFVTTLQYLHATNGEFVFDDHGSDWSVVAPNLDFSITKVLDYRGHASFSGGTVQIADYEPMWADAEFDFLLDGADVYVSRIGLETDGASTELKGYLDASSFPSMSYTLESDIDFKRMREIFFAADEFTTSGEGHFSGSFDLFEGGHDLKGTFSSPQAGFAIAAGEFDLPDFGGVLRWQRDSFEIWDGVSMPYGGKASYDFLMAKTNEEDPWQKRFEVHYDGLQVMPVARVFDLRGIEPLGRATGRNLLEWPKGPDGGIWNSGSISLTPPEGMRVAGPELPASAGVAVEARAGREPDLLTFAFPFGGGVDYRMQDGWIELANGQLATPSTHITFDGRSRFGTETEIPFSVVSTDWQESDRLLAATMTAFGAPTGTFAIDGAGRFDGVMLGDVSDPRVEARFDGEGLRAWNVEWGHGAGELVVENGYLDLSDGVFRRGAAQLSVDGRFSLSRPRTDGGEEMNGVFRFSRFPSANIRAAFGLQEGYSIEGPTTGEVHLYGAYRRLFGFGRMELDHPTAYGEPFDAVSAALLFEGTGVRLNGLEIQKGEGTATGAAFIEWDASYSFNLDARNVGVDTINFLPMLPQPPSGTLEGSASGVGVFDDPRYSVRATVYDMFIGDEEVGTVTGLLDVRDGALSLDLEAASSTIFVSATGQVGMASPYDADLSFRVANWSLDPYVRMFVPEWSPFTRAVLSGSMQVHGELGNWDHLGAEAVIEQADLSVFDYDVRNEGPIQLSLEQRNIGIDAFRLVGEGTSLELSGSADLAADDLAIDVNGNASVGILQGFLPDFRGSGAAVVEAQVQGPAVRPVLSGGATLTDGRLRHLSLPHGLEEINGRVVFTPGEIRFDDVPGRMGGGPVTIGGRIGLAGFQPSELAVTLRGERMQLRYPEGFRSQIDAELELTGDVAAPLLSGNVNVLDAVLLGGFDLGDGLFGGGLSLGTETAALAEEPAVPLRFDVEIVAPSTLRMTSNSIRAVASADLAYQGTLAQPTLFGTVEFESGETFIEGNRYRLNYGTVGFTNPEEIEPFIDVELETDHRVPGQTYRVTLRAQGTLERLVPSLSSDPPLPEVDILSMLLGDRRDPLSADLRAARAPELAQQQRFQAGAARLLTTPLSSGVGRVVQESFGVDTFQITPSLGDPSSQQSAQLNPTARVLIGKRISNRAHLTLSRALSGANRDLIMVLEYDQSDRLSWILSQNEDRTYALDFRVRHSF